MVKKTFLTKLKSKLSGLKPKEVTSIIEDYSMKIDAKMKMGKTVNEAIDSLGDIDILAAKIMDEAHQKKAENGQLEGFIDTFIEKMIKIFVKLFDNISEQKLSSALTMIIYIIIGLFMTWLFLWIISIPFEIVKEIGINLIAATSNNLFTDTLYFMWNLFVELSCLVVSILVVIILIKRIMIYFEENHNKKEVKKLKKDIEPVVGNFTKSMSMSVSEKSLIDFLTIFAKIFIIIFIFIPLLMFNISLIVLIGLFVFLAMQGVYSLGLTLILLGMSLIAIAMTSLITKFIFGKGVVK